MIKFIEELYQLLSPSSDPVSLDETKCECTDDDGKYRDLKDVFEDIDRIYSASDKTDVTE